MTKGRSRHGKWSLFIIYLVKTVSWHDGFTSEEERQTQEDLDRL